MTKSLSGLVIQWLLLLTLYVFGYFYFECMHSKLFNEIDFKKDDYLKDNKK